MKTVAAIAALCAAVAAAPIQILDKPLHLRTGGDTPEWASFPATSNGSTASLQFQAAPNTREYALVLRQFDVKKPTWAVRINGRKLGVLEEDERSMVRVLPIPAGTLTTGTNTLEIVGDGKPPSDDIEIRDVRIEPGSAAELLSQATISISAAGDSGPMPLKIAVADAKESLVPFATLRKDAYEARRTGILYTADGVAEIGVPVGDYRVCASRGFEYSAPCERVRVAAGTTRNVTLRLRKESAIPGYVSMDPHVHTNELSRHGDATVDERVLSAAGEGLDYIVATEHNMFADYSAAAKKRGLDRWLTVIPGNEVTGPIGHFNIFPVHPGTQQPDAKNRDWPSLMDSLVKTEGVEVVIQNHPRDEHLNYRPFDPTIHLSSVGANAIGRPVQANGMEVVNSGAMASDPMQVVRDWLGLLTRGLHVAGIGASDTHTVDFSVVGQARTYIQAPPRDAEAAIKGIAQARTLVSYGLAAEIRPAPGGADVIVYGPSWSSVDRVEVYSNGTLAWHDSFAPIRKPGIKYQRRVRLNLPAEDTALVAVATGPGVLEPFWEVHKPYQPTSPDWTPRVMGVSQALWVDRDGDGRITSPLEYAERLVSESAGDVRTLVRKLAPYDSAVTMHALELLRSKGALNGDARAAFESGDAAVRAGYERYRDEVARLKP